jgi:GNAT superfamily N-acetyltransferase
MELSSEQARATHGEPRPDAATVASFHSPAEALFADIEGPPRLVAAHAGDHALVYSLLRAVYQAPAHEDFNSWIDEPTYEPCDRLLVKHGEQIVAHAQLLHRAAMFHGVKLPVAGIQDLAVLPEYARAGYERLLIYAAEQAMRKTRAVVSLVRTERPEPLVACGWAEVRVPGYSRASVGDVLAHISAQRQHGIGTKRDLVSARTCDVFRRHAPPLAVRLWRHVELHAVRAVYDASAADRWGALCRTDQYWQWLVGRKAHSELIVASEGGDAADDVHAATQIVGYAVTHGSQVLELCCLPGYSRAGPRILARACQDAIERDYHTLSLHTAASDPLHELMVTAGGTWCTDSGTGGALLVKLLDPPQWIEAIFPLLRSRAKVARIARPCQVSIDTGSKCWRFILSRRSSRLVEDQSAAADAVCDAATFHALLVGNLDAAQIRAKLRPKRADRGTLDKLAALFPPALFWQSPFDALRY